MLLLKNIDQAKPEVPLGRAPSKARSSVLIEHKSEIAEWKMRIFDLGGLCAVHSSATCSLLPMCYVVICIRYNFIQKAILSLSIQRVLFVCTPPRFEAL